MEQRRGSTKNPSSSSTSSVGRGSPTKNSTISVFRRFRPPGAVSGPRGRRESTQDEKLRRMDPGRGPGTHFERISSRARGRPATSGGPRPIFIEVYEEAEWGPSKCASVEPAGRAKRGGFYELHWRRACAESPSPAAIKRAPVSMGAYFSVGRLIDVELTSRGPRATTVEMSDETRAPSRGVSVEPDGHVKCAGLTKCTGAKPAIGTTSALLPPARVARAPASRNVLSLPKRPLTSPRPRPGSTRPRATSM